MRRAILTLGGTAAGLAALLSFKTHSVAAAAPDAAPSPPAASAGPSQPMTKGTGSAPKASSGSGSMAASRTVTGTVASTQHGPMQVQLTLDGTKITKVTVLQRTNDGAESVQIDSTAIPQLTSETLTAQSAHIDAVSGATYTSSGYIQSLQSALDKAGT
jgi:uncharacterized protein with FMN-binding domain